MKVITIASIKELSDVSIVSRTFLVVQRAEASRTINSVRIFQGFGTATAVMEKAAKSGQKTVCIVEMFRADNPLSSFARAVYQEAALNLKK